MDPSPTAEATGGRPMGRMQVVRRQIGPRLDETLCVERETPSKPFCVGVRSGHHKHVLNVPGFARSRLRVVQENPLKARVAFERLDPGPSHERDPRARFDSRNQVSRHGFSEAGSSHHEINMLGGGGKENCRLPC